MHAPIASLVRLPAARGPWSPAVEEVSFGGYELWSPVEMGTVPADCLPGLADWMCDVHDAGAAGILLDLGDLPSRSRIALALGGGWRTTGARARRHLDSLGATLAPSVVPLAAATPSSFFDDGLEPRAVIAHSASLGLPLAIDHGSWSWAVELLLETQSALRVELVASVDQGREGPLSVLDGWRCRVTVRGRHRPSALDLGELSRRLLGLPSWVAWVCAPERARAPMMVGDIACTSILDHDQAVGVVTGMVVHASLAEVPPAASRSSPGMG